jgi:hypothetical protein
MKLVAASTPLSFLFAVTAQVNIAAAFIPEPKLVDIESIRSSALARPLPIPSTSTTGGSRISNDSPAVKKVSSSSSSTSGVDTTTNNKPLIKYRKWGVDNTNEDEYWFDSRIHTLGNCGFMGAVSDDIFFILTKMTRPCAFFPCAEKPIV